MRGGAEDDQGSDAVFEGGPMDGSEHRVDPGTAELVVVMEDGDRHRYVATDRVEHRPDGRLLPVFAYRGRELPLGSPDD